MSLLELNFTYIDSSLNKILICVEFFHPSPLPMTKIYTHLLHRLRLQPMKTHEPPLQLGYRKCGEILTLY